MAKPSQCAVRTLLLLPVFLTVNGCELLGADPMAPGGGGTSTNAGSSGTAVATSATGETSTSTGASNGTGSSGVVVGSSSGAPSGGTSTTATSTTGGSSGGGCITDDQFFDTRVTEVLQTDCMLCHNQGGIAAFTRNVLIPSSESGHLAANRAVFERLARIPAGDESLLLAKASGRADHGGGTRLPEGSDGNNVIREFLSRLNAPGGCVNPGAPPMMCPETSIGVAKAPLRRLTDVQLRNSVQDLLQVDVGATLYPATTRGEGFSTWPLANVVSSSGAENIMLAAERAASLATANLAATLGCNGGESQDVCVARFVAEFPAKAFRRPLTAQETATLQVVLTVGTTPAERVGILIEAVLQSPQFLYLDVVGAPLAGQPEVERFSDYATAARLSYFFLETTPDPDLRAAASEGRLRTVEQVRTQATRLVGDPRVHATLTRFHEDLAQLYQLDTIAKDPAVYPQFTPALVAAMREEQQRFVTQVVWADNPTLDTLLYSNLTFTNPALDTLYGTTGARTGTGWEARTLSSTLRPGLLSRTAFLTAHSYSATSSPVRRGAFVMKRMLCRDMTPPPGINLVLPGPTETNTIRDRLAGHRNTPACASCHDRIDPLGFSMEPYGALGEHRTAWENGITVDATGMVGTQAFDGVLQMIQSMNQENAMRDCYARQWYAFAHGRGVEEDELCATRRIERTFAAANGNIRDLLVSVVSSDMFLHRPTRVIPPEMP